MYINADMHAILFLFKPSLIFIRDRIGSVGNLVVVEEIVKKKKTIYLRAEIRNAIIKREARKL